MLYTFPLQIPVVLFHGSKTERPKMYKKLKTKVKVNDKYVMAPVVLTTFQVPLRESRFMSTFNWRYIIVDEGHVLKNSETQLSRFVIDSMFRKPMLLCSK